MSYFFEMPNFDDAGLGKVWDGMDVVARRVIQNSDFHIAAPMEFRFIKAGDSAMSGSYSENPDAIFVNLELEQRFRIVSTDRNDAARTPH
jgi:hypothetical protein